MKCQACKGQEAEWAWQPFGPGEDANVFALLGSHTRGFPVIKVCSVCQSAFQTGDFKVPFEYKGYKYVGQDHKVVEVEPHLWDGGECHFEHVRSKGTMIMKDAPGPSELVAVVCDDQQAFLQMFIAAPDLVAACEAIAEAFRNAEHLSGMQHLALARVHAALAASAG